MLSDEEREALEILNNTEWDGFMITIKNLIEKQSKEIEELKEENKKLTDEYLVQRDLINPDFLKDYISKEESEQKERKAYIKGTNDADELCNKKWKDKIKAKIEEYEEKIRRLKKKSVWEEPYDTEKYVRYTNYISVLQSLLEKE